MKIFFITLFLSLTAFTQTPTEFNVDSFNVDEGMFLDHWFTILDENGDIIGAPVGDPYTFSSDSLPGFAVLNTDTGILQATPSYDEAGIYSITISVFQSGSLYFSDSIDMVVNNVNRAPVLLNQGNIILEEGEELVLPFYATDPDGDLLSFDAVGVPPGCFFDNNIGLLNCQEFQEEASYEVTVTVCDDGSPSLCDSIQFTIEVESSEPPTHDDPPYELPKYDDYRLHGPKDKLPRR
ncbi:Ig domain-containing protein [Bacteriovoracaceae bacterium]|nr:Ig domain-containing protein [Bacteriovoracaceae bacterium]